MFFYFVLSGEVYIRTSCESRSDEPITGPTKTVTIFGDKAKRYVCMAANGSVYGSVSVIYSKHYAHGVHFKM